MKTVLFIPILFLSLVLNAQQPVRFSVQNSTFAGTDSVMPFWLSANRHGMIVSSGNFMNLTRMTLLQDYNDDKERFTYAWGVDALAAFSNDSYYQLNQAYGGVSYNGWILTAGLFHDETRLAGLSTSNRNIARSLNARPYPRILFAMRGYKPVPLIGEWVQFKASFSEGLLNDDRFVDRAHLHHKSLYLRVPVADSWMLEGGLEHFVMWGGVSPVESVGAMPTGLKAYLQYITGRSGDETFPGTDQLNVAGNQLGTYQFSATRLFQSFGVSFYLSHPFEDLSGMNWRNWPDNLLGLHVSFNDRQPITDVVYEYTNTRQQSIRGAWDRQEPDNYLNNGVYRSGHTYHQRVIGSPLFFPLTIQEGISRGITSNRLRAHHVGIRGNLSHHLDWKGMLTLVNHYGRYFVPFEPTHRQFSGYIQFTYANPDFPIRPSVAFGGDAGNEAGRNAALELSMKWVL